MLVRVNELRLDWITIIHNPILLIKSSTNFINFGKEQSILTMSTTWTVDKMSPFPPDNVAPEVKANEEWGLQAAKAVWSTDQLTGPTLFNRDYNFYHRANQWYFGNIDIDKYKPWLYVDPKDTNTEWLQSIDWEPVLYFAKRVNSAVSKVATIQYDPIVTAVSPNAVGEQIKFEAAIRAVMNRKEFFQNAGFDMTGLLPPGVAMDDVPNNDQELDLFMQMRYKHWASMKVELGIKDAINRLNYQEIKRQFDFDLVLWNIGRIETWMGSDFKPYGRRVDPRKSVIPESDKPGFEDNQFRGTIEEYSIAQIAVNHPHLSREKLDKVAEFSDKRYQGYYQDSFFRNDSLFEIQANDVERVRVLKFRIKTVNERVKVKMKDRHNNTILRDKGFNSLKTKGQQDQFKKAYGKTREFYRTKYNAVYEGEWVVGSDVLLQWRQVPYTIDTTLNEELLGDKVYVPNMRDGRTVSMAKQSLPILEAIHRQHLKIQQIVATDIPNGIRINMNALSEARLAGHDGRDLSDMQKIDLYRQLGILLDGSDPRDNRGAAKSMEPLSGGMSESIVNHMAILTDYLQKLDEVTGYNNASLGEQVNPRQGKGVTELQMMGTDTALEYIRHADFQITKAFYSNLGKLHALAEKYSPDKERSRRVYGTKLRPTAGVEKVAMYDYGINIMPQPTAQEWQQFYADIREAKSAGKITARDLAFLRLVDNLKLAYQYLAVFETKREEQVQQLELQKIKENNAGNAEAAQATSQGQNQAKSMELEKERIRTQGKIEEEQVRHQNELAKIQFEKDLELRNKKVEINTKGESDVETEIAKAEIQEEMAPNELQSNESGS